MNVQEAKAITANFRAAGLTWFVSPAMETWLKLNELWDGEVHYVQRKIPMKHARSDYDRFQDPEGKIPADEPVFLLRGQDELASDIVERYAMKARIRGLKDIAELADRHADAMRKWPKKKLPDLAKAILLSLGVLFFGADVAKAQSYACDKLYYLRNDFYDAKGLCFTRPGALARYPHNPATCKYETSDDLPLSASETRMMEHLREREIALGCVRK